MGRSEVMRSRVEKVSPSLARRWIEASEDVRQRTVVRRRVEKLAHAINSGQWRVTHQGIALTEDGVVLDGQHRLHAIIAADETVDVLVVRGVDPEVFGVLDTGASRTPADSLKIAGYKDTNVLAAMVRTILVYDAVAGTTAGDWSTVDRQVTTADILEWLDDPDRVEAAYAAMGRGRRVAGAVARHGATTPISAANLIVDLYPTDIGPATIAEFNERLIDGVLLGPRSPILAFRRWLVAETGYVNLPHSVRRPTTVGVFLKAINDYAIGHERSLAIFRFGRELMPLPIPPGSIEAYARDREAEAEARELADEEGAAAAAVGS
jgi:hypothetical protein